MLPKINQLSVRDVLIKNLHKSTVLRTDESTLYTPMAKVCKSHEDASDLGLALFAHQLLHLRMINPSASCQVHGPHWQ